MRRGRRLVSTPHLDARMGKIMSVSSSRCPVPPISDTICAIRAQGDRAPSARSGTAKNEIVVQLDPRHDYVPDFPDLGVSLSQNR